MRIASLVPHATELLFALGAGGDVLGVTHECDHPPEVPELERLTRDVLPAGLSAREIDAAVRERTLERGSHLRARPRGARGARPGADRHAGAVPGVRGLLRGGAGDRRGAPVQPDGGRAGSEDARTRRSATCARSGEATGRERAAEELLELGRRADRRGPRSGAGGPAAAGAGGGVAGPGVRGRPLDSAADRAGRRRGRARASPGSPRRSSTGRPCAAARPEVVVVMPCGYDAPRAREEALAYAAQLAGLGAGRVVAVDAAAYFSRAGSAADRRAGAAGPHPAPGARALAARGRARRSRSSSRFRAEGRRRPLAAHGPACSSGRSRSSPRRPPRRSPRSRRGPGPGWRRTSPKRSTAAASAPPIRPPMCPPQEIPGIDEADDQVEHDQPPHPALEERDLAGAHLHRGGAHQPEDRARGADGDRMGRDQQGSERAAQQRDRRRSSANRSAPEGGLQHHPEVVQDPHVEADVDDVLVEEAGADDPPPFSVGDPFAGRGSRSARL